MPRACEGQEAMHHALRESAAYVGYQLTDHTCIEGGEEPVESLGRVVGLSVCIAEPLECRDTDDPIKRTRTKAQGHPDPAAYRGFGRARIPSWSNLQSAARRPAA